MWLASANLMDVFTYQSLKFICILFKDSDYKTLPEFMSKSPRHRRPLIEALEPRLLFSATADIAVFDDGNADGQYLAQAAGQVDLVSIYMSTEPLGTGHSANDLAPQADLPVESTVGITTVIFVDTAVDNYAALVKDINAGLERNSVAIIYLDSTQDGLAQINNYLAGASGISAIHILSHGIAGNVQLGNQVLNESTIGQFKEQIAAWQTALTNDADILFYGCDLAANQSGVDLLRQLSVLTGADIAASNNVTGNSSVNADWVLEEKIGTVETASLFAANQPMEWQGALADVVRLSSGAPTNQQAIPINGDIKQGVQLTSTQAIDRVQISLANYGTASSQIVMKIHQSNYGGPVVATASVATSSIGNSLGVVNFDFAAVNLSAYVIYWVSFATNDRVDNLVSLGYINSDVITSEYVVDNVGTAGRDMSIALIDVQNQPPTLANPIADQAATEDTVFNFSVPANTFNDTDGDTLSYSAELANGSALPSWLNFNASTKTFSGVPTNGDVGTLSVKVIANDGHGATVNDTFDIVIANVNDAPVLDTPVPNQNATEDSAFTYTFPDTTFSDGDVGTTFTYTAELAGGGALPTWLTLDSSTRTFSGTPANGDVGTISIKLTASDGAGGVANDTFDIIIANTNDAPTVANAIPNQVATENALFNFSFAINAFTDMDVGNSLTYSAQLAGGGVLPGWLSFDAATRTFNGTPQNADVGSVAIDVIASDGSGATAMDTFTIVIGAVNDSPYLVTPIPNQNATEDIAFNFQFSDATFDDIDVGDTLIYSATMADDSSLPGWLTFDELTRTFSGTPTNADVGTISIKVVADDGNGGMVASDIFDLVIANTNDAPTIANPIPNQNAQEDSPFNFTFASTVFTDQDVGNTLTYSVQLGGGGALPAWISFDPASRTFSGTPLNANVGTLSIDVIANDGNGGTVTDTFNIIVANTNDAPTIANPIGNQNATEDTAFNFQFAANTFSDQDVGNNLVYSAQMTGGWALPSWLSFDSATRTFSGTPINDDVGTISIDVMASDGNGGTVTDTFSIIIANTNDAPTVLILPTDYAADEQQTIDLHGTGISVTDVDGDALTITIAAAGTNSSIAASVGTTGVVLVSGYNTNTLILTGTAAQLNDLFAGNNGSTLTYRLSGDTPVASRLLTISASDGNLSGSDTAIINITALNDHPENTVPVAQATNEDTALVFSVGNSNQIQINDLDVGAGDLEITLSVTNGTLTLAGVVGLVFTTGDGTADSSLVFRGTQTNINAALATLTFTPTPNYTGTAILSLTTDDLGSNGAGGALTDVDTVNITINSTNDAPTLANPIADQAATEDAAFNFQFAVNTFADSDVGDTLTYTAQLAGGGALPTWLSFDPVTRTFSGIPANGDVGTVSIDVIADDGNGGTITDTFNVVVGNTNDAPIFANPIADQTVTEDAAFNFQFAVNTFADSDVGDTLTYSAQLAGGGVLPSWLSFDPVIRTFSGTPANGDVGNIAIDVIANDGNGGAVTDTFSIVVASLNDAPVTSGFTPINDIEDAAGATVNLFAAFSDEETAANQLQYFVVSNSNPALVSSAVIDAATGTLQLRYGANQFGSCDLVIRTQDAQGASVETALRINIQAVNDVPTATGIADVRVQAGGAAQQTDLHSVFSDIEDGVLLKYTLLNNSNPAAVTNVHIDPATGVMTLIFASSTGGEALIILRATDSNGAWVDAQYKVTVIPLDMLVPIAPVTPPAAPITEIPVTAPPDTTGDGDVIEAPLLPTNPDEEDTYVPVGGVTDLTNLMPRDDSEHAEFTSANNKSSRDYLRADEFLNKNNVLLTTLTASTSQVSLISLDSGFTPWEAEEFDNEVRRIRAQMDEAMEEEYERKSVVAGLTFSVTTGLLVWSLRASSLLLTMMSMLPLWRGIDPLPILDEVNKKKKELEQQRKDREREDKNKKEVGYMFDHAQNRK